MKFNPTTPINLYVKNSNYVPGEGHETTWQLLESIYKNATETEPALKTSVFYVEWKGGFGDRLMAAQAIGVSDMATIRTFYNPVIFEAAKTKEVLVVLNCDSTAFIENKPNVDSINLYEIWGGIDNVDQQNQFMEFKVRRYEAK